MTTPFLNEHIGNIVAVETARGFRLSKQKSSKKIDAAVALSMAHYGASLPVFNKRKVWIHKGDRF